MKKLVTLVTSVTVFAGQILNPIIISAMKVDDEGGEYWYIPETIIHDKEVEAEIAEACAGSHNYNYCLNVARGRRINSEGNRYQAVWQLRHSRFLITAVNPYRSTIRVYYAGENSVSSTEKANLTELYLYWMDNGKVTPEFNRELYDVYFNQIKSGESEDGIHIIYAGARSGDGSWIETEDDARLVLPTGSLTNNTNGQIFYTIVNDFGDVYSGFYKYQNSCVDNEYFGIIGQECLGAYYIKNNAFTYALSPYDEIEEDRELEISPLVAEPTATEDSEELEALEDPGEPANLEEPEIPENSEDPINPEGPEDFEWPIDLEESTIPEDQSESATVIDIPTDSITNPESTESTEPNEEPSSSDLEPEEFATNLGYDPDLTVTKPEELGEQTESIKIEISDTSNVGFSGDIINNITDKTPKTPNTGEASNDDSDADWCLPMVISLFVAYVIWWIAPVGKKKRQ